MSSSSYKSAAGPIPTHCSCRVPVAHKQSWTTRNPGRRFVVCKFFNPSTGMKGCDTFCWVDSRQEEWQRLLINQLVLEKQLLERQLDHLKPKVCALEDQNSKLLKLNEKLKTKYNNKNKRNNKKEGTLCYFVATVTVVIVTAVVLMFLAYA